MKPDKSQKSRLIATQFIFVILGCTIWILNVSAKSTLPQKADIAKIYNIEKAKNKNVDVRYFRKGVCTEKDWCSITGPGQHLKAKDYLKTGEVSRVDLALMYNETKFQEVLFWQQEGSRSRFDPKQNACFFEVETGGFLYAHPHQSSDPGCNKIVSKNAIIFPVGTVLFIYGLEKETTVGILSNPSNQLIKVQNSISNKSVSLKAGQYAKSQDDGKITHGNFNLEEFYKKNERLTLGLGTEIKDNNYVARQEAGIQLILKKLRVETIKAIVDQDIKIVGPSNVIDPPVPLGSPGVTGTTVRLLSQP